MIAYLGVALWVMGMSAVLPWVKLRAANRKGEGQWVPRIDGLTQVGNDYRTAASPTFAAPEAPIEVKLAAVGCWALGQMFVPGLIAGLVGLMVVVGLASIPGLILAARLFSLAEPLMRGEIAAAAEANTLARYVTILNVLILAVLFCAAGGAVTNLVAHESVAAFSQALPVALPIAFYAAISLLHADLLRRAAQAVVANHHAQTVMDTHVRIDDPLVHTVDHASAAVPNARGVDLLASRS
ncbi:MAG: hypothetical protein Q8Q09_01870 [Deltaproteobacteria bacterium]|nr:hypothetical protein [Deltaproteobacteria bacterium]